MFCFVNDVCLLFDIGFEVVFICDSQEINDVIVLINRLFTVQNSPQMRYYGNRVILPRVKSSLAVHLILTPSLRGVRCAHLLFFPLSLLIKFVSCWVFTLSLSDICPWIIFLFCVQF